MMLPGCKSAFRAGFWPDCYRENTEIGPPAGPKASRKADFGSFPVAVRLKSGPEGRFPARKNYCVTSSSGLACMLDPTAELDKVLPTPLTRLIAPGLPRSPFPTNTWPKPTAS